MTTERPRVSPAGRYTQAQAARLLGVDRRTVMRWRDSGHIRSLDLQGCSSGRVYYKGSEILKAWANH